MRTLTICIFSIIAIFITSCDNCDEIITQPCGEQESMENLDIKVDLVVVADYSGSMGQTIGLVSLALSEGVKSSLDSCNTDLRVQLLGLDGSGTGGGFVNSVFNISQRDYLDSVTGGAISSGSIMLAADRPDGGLLQEQGANAVEDISNHFDWREGACRAIFYISDEELDSLRPMRGDIAHETSEVNAAIAAAIANDVSVFSHLIDSQDLGSDIFDLYEKLSADTDGFHIKTAPAQVTQDLYTELLSRVICNSCGVSVMNDPCKLRDFVN